MRIVKAIENMTASNQKLMYMCNTRPVLKTGRYSVTLQKNIEYRQNRSRGYGKASLKNRKV